MRRVSALVTWAAIGGLSAISIACSGDDESGTDTGSAAGSADTMPQATTNSGSATPQSGGVGTPAGGTPVAGEPSPAAPAGGEAAGTPVAGATPVSPTPVSGPAGAEPSGGEPATSEPVGSEPAGGVPATGEQTPAAGEGTPEPAPGGEPSEPVDEMGGEETQPDVDQNGKMNAAPGDSTGVAQDYLRLGEIRILNNNWGSAERGCDSQMSVFVAEDRSFGWTFNRGACGGGGSQPDFPQVEFGIHPFGIGSSLATSPEFTSTTLLPAQIKNISSASVNVDNLRISLQGQQAWNITMEFWLSERDPVNDPSPGVYAEIMAFWGWQNMRWPCDSNDDGFEDLDGDSVQAGNMAYKLCHKRDDWANNQWRYFQFRAGDGSDGNISTSFNGTIDVKAFLDYVVNTHGYSPDLWVTRLEVGSEIDDNTSGEVRMNGITFEVNGQTRSQVIAP